MVDARMVDVRPETEPKTQIAVDRVVEQAMQQSDEPAPTERLRDPEY